MNSVSMPDPSSTNEQYEFLASIGHWLTRLFVASLLLPATGAWAQNFAANEPELVRIAEDAREKSARFWSGQPLPGDWYKPCPVFWQTKSGPGSGWTRFQIQNDEVFDWQMTLRGNRDAVLRDVIPHEVDHTVRASLCRRPLPRWLDEGCASLFESAESHTQLRQQLLNYRERYLTVAMMDQMDYPPSSSETSQLYAEGFSFVEYLLSLGTPRQLLQLQQSNEPPSRSLVNVYRQRLPQLLSNWHHWEQERLKRGPGCDCAHCPRHHIPDTTKTTPATTPPKPPLTIWTATWCTPCQNFHHDLTTRPQFRKHLEANYQLVERDIDRDPLAAQQAKVSTIPTFETAGHRINGYLGPDWLLQQLGIGTVSPPLGLPQTTPVDSPIAPPTQSPDLAVDPLSPRIDTPRLATPPPLESLPSQPSTPASTPALESVPPANPASDHPPPLKPLPPWNRILELIPPAVTILSSIGIIGGTAATGGVGGVALMILLKLLKRRATRVAEGKATTGGNSSEGGADGATRAPFPRQLDEAGELLGLRQSEGRVATLDTLRGMFLDDELDKLKNDPDTQVAALVRRIREAVDTRVDEVAPLTTKV